MGAADATATLVVVVFERWAGTTPDREHVVAMAGIGAAAAARTETTAATPRAFATRQRTDRI